MKDEREFYIGWQSKAPAEISQITRRAVLLLLVMCLTAAMLFALCQRTIGVSVFEWGTLKNFSGTLVASPYPHLVVHRPGLVGEGGADSKAEPASDYILVKPFKFGLDADLVKKFDGQTVSLRGTLIYREHQAMIEVLPESIKADLSAAGLVKSSQPTAQSFGTQTLVGEIVDSKCFLGVMNPGRFQAHRACAVRCISGGCPPLFVTQKPDGSDGAYYLLVGLDGSSVNQRVLDKVAEPLEITGKVERQGGLLVLKADPGNYRRRK